MVLTKHTAEIMKHYLRPRHNCFPSLHDECGNKYEEGAPLVSPMYTYPETKKATMPNHFFGSELMVAPLQNQWIRITNSKVQVWFLKENGMISSLEESMQWDVVLDIYRDIESIPVFG